MHAEDAAGVLFHQNLAQAFAALVLRHIAAGIDKGKLLAIVLDALLLGGFLGFAHAGDLRIGIDHRRDGLVAHVVPLAGHMVDRNLGLPVGGVRQHRFAVDVAGRVHIRDVGHHVPVGYHRAPLQGDADILQADALGNRAAADGAQGLGGLAFDDLAVLFINHRAVLDLGDLACELEVHALLLIGL